MPTCLQILTTNPAVVKLAKMWHKTETENVTFKIKLCLCNQHDSKGASFKLKANILYFWFMSHFSLFNYLTASWEILAHDQWLPDCHLAFVTLWSNTVAWSQSAQKNFTWDTNHSAKGQVFFTWSYSITHPKCQTN